METKIFKIRDKRRRDFFTKDNEFVDYIGKLVGVNAIAIYDILCRHVNDDGKCFPSIATLMEKSGIKSRTTVIQALKKLVGVNVISITRERTKSGKWLNNIYWLLDKSVWKYSRENSHVQNMDTNNTNLNNTNICKTNFNDSNTKKDNKLSKSLSDKPTFSLKDELKKFKSDNRRYIQIVGLWIDIKGLKPNNSQQFRAIVNRNLRPAKALEGYSDKDIKGTFESLLKTEYLSKFTLETIGKYIDDYIAKRKTGRRIVEWKQLKDEKGMIVMRPIYEALDK